MTGSLGARTVRRARRHCYVFSPPCACQLLFPLGSLPGSSSSSMDRTHRAAMAWGRERLARAPSAAVSACESAPEYQSVAGAWAWLSA